MCYLRNSKHVPCCYRVVETRVEVWETEKCCGNTSRRRVFPQLFRVLPNLHECFYNSIETERTCLRFLQETPRREKGKQLVNFDYENANIFAHAITTSTARARSVSPSSYTNAIFNQSACLLSQVFFKYDIFFVSCKILRTSRKSFMLVVQM